jgi:ribosomal peptide maturation radical SAM protein 1
MPFAPLYSPSLGLSLLAGQLEREDVDVHIRYFSIDFAKQLGEDLYTLLAEGLPSTVSLSGEWLFSHCLFARKENDTNDYIRSVVEKEYHATSPLSFRLDSVVKGILDARAIAESFIDQVAQEITDIAPQIVGFTSVFQQHVASLAVARRLKQIRPDITVVFGGANCEAEMGQENLNQFDFVDIVVSGEGELAFARIVLDCFAGRKDMHNRPNVYRRHKAEGLVSITAELPTAVRLQMDDLPWPDYREYFAQAEQARIERNLIRLLFESSRGCWWGEKHHCTFCGLNGSDMRFRSKSPHRCLEELKGLYEQFGIAKFSATDNIMDPRHLESFFPALADAQLPVELFYEVKANLKKNHLRLLRNAGVTSLQPGIESLDSGVLAEMRKGITALQNIQTLKWCKEFGIEVAWNILWGFPHEKAEAYREMRSLVLKCEHLPPPLGVRKIRMDRFSPNYTQGEKFGFTNIRAATAYKFLYPFEQGVLDRLAYYFESDSQVDRAVMEEVEQLQTAVSEWISAQESSDLVAVDKGSSLIVVDLRSCAAQVMHVFEGIKRRILLICDEIHSLNVVCKAVGEEFPNVENSQVLSAIRELIDAGFMILDGGKVLSLPVLAGEYSPSRVVLEKLLAKSVANLRD